MRPTTSWRLPSAIDRSAFDRFTPFCDFRRRGPQWRLDVDTGRLSFAQIAIIAKLRGERVKST
jgi:hypothetical protein